MLRLYDNPTRQRLVKEIHDAFVLEGWETKKVGDDRFDLQVRKQGLRIFVACFDKQILSYLSEGELVARLRKQASEFAGKMGVSHLAILNFSFAGTSTEILAESGALIYTSEEVSQISQIYKYYDTLPLSIDKRTTLLIQGNVDLSVSIADAFKKQGDYDAAKDWLERGISGSVGVSIAYRKLATLFSELGEVSSLEKLCEQVLLKNPKNVEFLALLRDLYRKLGDEKSAKEMQERVNNASLVKMDFESILQRQKAHASGASPKTNDPSTSSATSPKKASVRTILKSIFIR